jgi:hypothetical protein
LSQRALAAHRFKRGDDFVSPNGHVAGQSTGSTDLSQTLRLYE